MSSIVIYGSQYGTARQYAEVHAMLETYGKQVSFVDFDTLEPLVTAEQAADS